MRAVVLVCIAFLSAAGASYQVTPSQTLLGHTLRVMAQGDAVSARMAGHTVRLFRQGDGTRMGLMPVSVKVAPGPYELEFLDDNGRVISAVSVRVKDGRFPKQNITLSKATSRLRPSPGEMKTVSALRKTVTDIRHWDEPFVQPVPGCQTSPFGVQRLYNRKPSGNYHSGVDQRGAAGTPIRAVAGGAVQIARMFNVHGGTVGIDHGQGVVSAYLHMSDFAVKEGDLVRKGDVIGYVGTTGRSTAPHLHWGIAVNGVHVNPAQWVKLEPCAAPAAVKRRVRKKR